MKASHASFRFRSILVCLLLNYVWSSPTPLLYANDDIYEVQNDGNVEEHRFNSKGVQWKIQTNLHRLEVLSNDRASKIPLESCIEEKLTGQIKYEDQGEKNSKFEEIHEKAGFRHVHRSSMAVRPHCVFDVIVPFENSSQSARIPGEFCTPEHVTGGAAVGDYNGDGLEDIYFSVFEGRSVLYKNNGDGTFTDVSKETNIGPSSRANGAVWADFDQDGDMDLYVTTVGDTRHYLYINYNDWFIEEAIKRNCSMQTSDKRKLSGMTPNVGDFDNDGFVDIYVTEWLPHTLGKPSTSRLLRNKGYLASGYFEDVTFSSGVDMDNYYHGSSLNRGTYTFGSSFTDFDSDGWQELLVTADYGDSKMFWNAQNNNFNECTQPCGLTAKQDAMGHAIGDWDNDGNLDWFSSAIWHNRTECSVSGCKFDNSGNVLFRNLGGRRFEDATMQAGVTNGGWGWGAAFIDVDNNGFLDIIMTSGIDFPTTTTDDHFRGNTIHLWRNLGAGYNGTTQEVSALYGLNGTAQGRGMLKWDFDDDGDEDIVVCNNVGEPFFYQNQQKESNKWIRIRVMHRCLMHDNKLCDSLGAQVKVIMENGHTQTQEIGSSTHYLGQSSHAAHFGLGQDSGNVTVKVRWPYVKMDVTYTNVTPNTRLRVLQPERPVDSGKVFPYSSLDKCYSIKVMEITKQPPHATVTINPNGRTVNFQRKPGIPLAEISTETFTYKVGLVPTTGNQQLLDNATCHVIFSFERNYTESECHGGRKIGPRPTVIDGRRLDGTSYNKFHVWWGAAMEDVTREVPAIYPDGIALPAGTCSPEEKKAGKCRFTDEVNGFGSHRPPPRTISNALFKQIESKISARRLNDLHSHFGQFLVHDTDFSSPLPRYEFQGVLSDVWLPIKVPKGDVHFDPSNEGDIYLPFVRSTYNRCTGRHSDTPRQQVNKLTSYIDGSVVYGSSESRNRALREFKDGKLKLGSDGLIPKNTMALENDNPLGRDPNSLLVAGDSRANVQPMLIAFHTLFVREHNRLCDEYKKIHPQATDEQLFQAARRIVAAELQAITFREYLPALLGGTKHIPPHQGYNNSINVGISNIMATAAYRFGHSQVNTHLWRLEEDGSISPNGHLALRDAYFAPERVSREGGIDPLFRGAVKQAAQEIDLEMVDDMRNVLFPSGNKAGLDLAAMNIQRGRDHGLPDYKSVRKALGLKEIQTFHDITNNSRIAQKMEDIYQDLDTVDLWVGGLAEDHEDGSELGETFRTIVMRNFLRIRDGDRFWYESYLSKEEIDTIHSLTLSKIIRLNTGFKSAPDNIFFSTEHCSTVTNFWCIPHKETEIGNCTDIQQTLWTLRQELKRQKEICRIDSDVSNTTTQQEPPRSALFYISISLALVALFFLALFLRVWIQLRRKQKAEAEKNVGHELSSRDNFVF